MFDDSEKPVHVQFLKWKTRSQRQRKGTLVQWYLDGC